MTHNAAEWIQKAENDLLAADNNITAARVPWDAVCFHTQQAAEKYLKALLAALGVTPPKTHDLIPLLAQTVRREPGLASLEPDAQLLSDYAVLSRYPGASQDLTTVHGHDARAAADRIRAAIRAVLSQRGVQLPQS